MSTATASAPLAGLRVLDLSESLSGQFAGRLFADNGASVVIGEPEGGSALRGVGPFRANGESLLFWHLNTGKGSLTVCGDAAASISGSRAHVVLAPTQQLAAEWAVRFPEVVVGVAPAFAPDGPYADWAADELILQALSGTMHYNGRAGQKPLYGAGRRIEYGTGLLLYSRVLAELVGRARGAGSAGHPIRVVAHEIGVMMEQGFSAQYAYSGTYPLRGELLRPTGRVKAADGWVVFFNIRGRREELFKAFQAEDLLDDERFLTHDLCSANIIQMCAEFTKRVEHLPRAVLWQAALDLKLALSPVVTLDQLQDDEQLAYRGFWNRVDGRTVLGPMWRATTFDWAEPAAAPTRSAEVGANSDTFADASEWSFGGTVSDRGGATPEHPLQGLRVVDLTTAWAGPLTARILGTLGADIVKVEGPRNLDGWRAIRDAELFPDRVLGERPYDRMAWFNTMNQGKRDLVVESKSPEGLAIVRGLVRRSDIVLANFSPHTTTRMGIGFDVLSADNPGVVMVEMSAFGDDGPLEVHRGFGQTMEALSGIASLIGYEHDDEPLGSKPAYNDPMGALAGVAAVLTGLMQRLRVGSAQYIEVPQREAAMHWIGELILDAVDERTPYRQSGNAVETAYPHDAIAVDDADNWVAISISTAVHWRALCGHFGWVEWADDPALASVEGRRARAREIDAALAEAVRAAGADGAEKGGIATALQSAGVPAAPVQNGRNLFEDPQLRTRHWFRALTHPDAGTHEYPGVPIEGPDGRIIHVATAGPSLGEHTIEVLAEIDEAAGMDLDDLVARQIVVVAPPMTPTATGGAS